MAVGAQVGWVRARSQEGLEGETGRVRTPCNVRRDRTERAERERIVVITTPQSVFDDSKHTLKHATLQS